MTNRPQIALFCSVTPAVYQAVTEFADLPEWDSIAPQQAATITRTLTRAMVGAPVEMLDRFPNLRQIVSCGAGMDKFDTQMLADRGITLHNTASLMTADTAEMAVTMLFSLLRQIVPQDRLVRSGDWAQTPSAVTTRIAGKRVGILGLGQIGGTIARTLSAIGLEIAYTGRAPRADVPWAFHVEPRDLADWADVLIVSCSAGPTTARIVNAPVLEALGADGFLINISRGSVVDETALITALQARSIAGAALDVFEGEPAPDPRFAGFDTVLLSPHAATLTAENRREMGVEVARLLSLPQ